MSGAAHSTEPRGRDRGRFALGLCEFVCVCVRACASVSLSLCGLLHRLRSSQTRNATAVAVGGAVADSGKQQQQRWMRRQHRRGDCGCRLSSSVSCWRLLPYDSRVLVAAGGGRGGEVTLISMRARLHDSMVSASAPVRSKPREDKG